MSGDGHSRPSLGLTGIEPGSLSVSTSASPSASTSGMSTVGVGSTKSSGELTTSTLMCSFYYVKPDEREPCGSKVVTSKDPRDRFCVKEVHLCPHKNKKALSEGLYLFSAPGVLFSCLVRPRLLQGEDCYVEPETVLYLTSLPPMPIDDGIAIMSLFSAKIDGVFAIGDAQDIIEKYHQGVLDSTLDEYGLPSPRSPASSAWSFDHVPSGTAESTEVKKEAAMESQPTFKSSPEIKVDPNGVPSSATAPMLGIVDDTKGVRESSDGLNGPDFESIPATSSKKFKPSPPNLVGGSKPPPISTEVPGSIPGIEDIYADDFMTTTWHCLPLSELHLQAKPVGGARRDIIDGMIEERTAATMRIMNDVVYVIDPSQVDAHNAYSQVRSVIESMHRSVKRHQLGFSGFKETVSVLKTRVNAMHDEMFDEAGLPSVVEAVKRLVAFVGLDQPHSTLKDWVEATFPQLAGSSAVGTLGMGAMGSGTSSADWLSRMRSSGVSRDMEDRIVQLERFMASVDESKAIVSLRPDGKAYLSTRDQPVRIDINEAPSKVSLEAFVRLEEITRELTTKVKHMERRGASLAIKMGSHMFASVDDVRQFVREHMCGCHNVAVLSDFVYLLSRVNVKNRLGDDTAVTRAVQGSKIQLDPVEASVLNSFSISIPSCLSSTTGTLTSGTKPLPSIPTRESWSNPVAGRQMEIEREIYNERRVVEDRIEFLAGMSPHGAEVCRLMLIKAINHWIATSQFIDSFFHMCNLTYNLGEQDAHYLATAMMRQVFVALRRQRVAAQDLINSGDKEMIFVRTMWALLQSHAMMDEFVAKKISGHHEMTDVVYAFVLGNRVSSSDVKKTQESAAQAQALVQYVDKDLSRVLQKLELTPTARPNKKKNGNGAASSG